MPEDRLRATISGGLILAPCSIIASGIVTQYMDNNTANMILNFVCLFLNGIGVSSATSCLMMPATDIVDCDGILLL